MAVPLDEFPIHQAPLSLGEVGSSDRNAYDRCYFNAHDRTGDVFVVVGMGVYPNLGVMDAFACVRTGSEQVTVRASDALHQDRLRQQVGPIAVEVVDPLRVVRVHCDTEAVALDLTWHGAVDVVDEPHHRYRPGSGRIVLDAHRFAQLGRWSGHVVLDQQEWSVTPGQWLGTRDRSWGIRPVGEPEPGGRPDEDLATFGFWWTYVPLLFDDHALLLMAQEDGNGFRTHNEALRVFPTGSGRQPEQLGWPRFAVRYRSGTRHPEGATIHATEPDGRPVVVDLHTLGAVVLGAGPGYGGDPSWSHGMWRERNWVDLVRVDLDDPTTAGIAASGVVDHVARATVRTADGPVGEGWGMFEHGTLGRHTPSGFTDWSAVAP